MDRNKPGERAKRRVIPFKALPRSGQRDEEASGGFFKFYEPFKIFRQRYSLKRHVNERRKACGEGRRALCVQD